MTWRDIEWLRGLWKGTLLLKGVLEVDDARAAVDAGAGTVLLRGLTVSTRRAGLRVDCPPPAALAVGQRVDLRARLAADRRTLEATRITCR